VKSFEKVQQAVKDRIAAIENSGAPAGAAASGRPATRQQKFTCFGRGAASWSRKFASINVTNPLVT